MDNNFNGNTRNRKFCDDRSDDKPCKKKPHRLLCCVPGIPSCLAYICSIFLTEFIFTLFLGTSAETRFFANYILYKSLQVLRVIAYNVRTIQFVVMRRASLCFLVCGSCVALCWLDIPYASLSQATNGDRYNTEIDRTTCCMCCSCWLNRSAV